MKAIMVVLVMGMAHPHEAEFDSMEACLKHAPIVQAQAAVEEAACVPYTPRKIDLSNFQVMADSFLMMVDQFRQRADMWEAHQQDDSYQTPSEVLKDDN